MTFTKLIREPLLHFALVGLFLFAVYGWTQPELHSDERVVHITSSEVDWLRNTWERQRQRPPDEQELRGLLSDYLREKLLAREALALGLDEDDIIVRRRLAQKMEFLVRDTAGLAEPTAEELQSYYQANASKYTQPARLSFTHVYYKHESDAVAARSELGTTGVVPEGDAIMIECEFTDADAQGIAAVFGPDFSAAVASLDVETWAGPVASGYGYHLVHIHQRTAAQPAEFDEVRDAVMEDWYRTQQDDANRRYLADLMDAYTVIVDEDVKPVMGPLAGVAK